MSRVIFIICLLFFSTGVFACTCLSASTFCESISRFTDPSSRIILIGKVSIDNERDISISVQDVISGQVKSDELILGYGMCDIYHIPIEDKEEYLFALREHDNRYFIFGCATSYLKVEGNEVVGRIAPGIDKVKIDKLSELDDCGNVFKSFSDQIEIFPNPTTDILNIKNSFDENSFDDAQIRIFDTSGKVVGWRNNSAILNDEDWIIYLEDLPSGVYLMQIANRFNTATKKVVKI